MSVYLRGGVYWYEFIHRGHRIRESTGLTNKTAAGRAESIRKAELIEGRAGIKRRKCPTFKDFLEDEFLPWAKSEHREHPNTYQRYVDSSKPLIRFFGKLPLDSICSGTVEKFKAARSTEVSNAGTNRDMAAFRLAFNFAIRNEYVNRNPVRGVKFLPEGPGCMRIVSYEEQKRYLENGCPLLRDIATLILETGMRPDEVYRMRADDVHLPKRYLFIPSGKTRFARRNVPLTESAIEILKRRMARRKGSYLFPHRLDPEKPITSAQKGHEAALDASGIKPRFRIYDLRHTFGSRSAMAGVDLATLKELMGHSTITMTMRYVHPTPEHKQEAVRKLEQFNFEQMVAAAETAVPTKVPAVRIQ